MKEIQEQTILSLSPDSASTSNAKKLSSKGDFLNHSCSADGTFYTAECRGSGKSNYVVSIDFSSDDSPVFRCNCPSRKLPCKHSLGLMYEILNKKNFSIIEIPTDIVNKRNKSEVREQKKSEKKDTPPKVNKAALAKKIKKQIEGLDVTTKIINELLNKGLGTLEGNSIKTYKDLAKQLGDYYLPGAQNLVKDFIIEIIAIQKDPQTIGYDRAISTLCKLNALVKKAKAYLTNKIENEIFEKDNNELFEALGGIWKLEDLDAIGLKKENVRLIQLSFYSYYDQAREEFIDTGFWADTETGELLNTFNYRPIKALKYVKQEDSMLSALIASNLYYYPGDANRRVRWEKMHIESINENELISLMQKALEVKPAVKNAKNYLKNTMADKSMNMMIKFKQIGMIDGKFVLEDNAGDRIVIADHDIDETTFSLSTLPNKDLLQNNVLFGLMFYDNNEKRIAIQPYSIITEKNIVRLKY